MINAKCLERDWIREQSKRLRARGDHLVEKCIFAFALVGRLRQEGLDFVFKGGTSLILHVQPIRRLSIDVDIITNADVATIQEVLGRVVTRPPFNRFVYQARRDRENPPTRYFQLYYNSAINGGQENQIQLDVIIEKKDVYPGVVEMPLRVDLFEVDDDITVFVPPVDILLGDKLTAFAPSTVGVLYQPLPRNPGDKPPDPDPLRVVKQMFDVGILFEYAQDLEVVAGAYDAIFPIQQEARQPHIKCMRESALDDTIDAARHVAELNVSIPKSNEKTDFLRAGIRNLDSHLLAKPFSFPTAQIYAARAAYLATLIKNRRFDIPITTLRTVPTPDELASLHIDGPNAPLDILKKISPEAYYRWYQIERVQEG